MFIRVNKSTPYKSEYKIIRADGSRELIELETKTFFIHDICHYVVERNLKYNNGFWGMLAQGYRFDQLFGKENVLTEDLRFIEKIVGPVQAVYLGHFKKEDLPMLISHLDFELTSDVIEQCLVDTKVIEEQWVKLEVGESMGLEFVV